MSRPTRRRLLSLVAAFVTALALLPAGATAAPSANARARPAGPPQDFIAQSARLSQPRFDQVVQQELRVPMPDGTEVYVEVTMPDPAVYGERRWPVIMEASPYHGTLADREGIRIFPDPENAEGEKIGMTGYFAPRGYAVAMVDLRGTGLSDGCLDHLGPKDAADLEAAIEWAADQPWSTGKVGLTGHSYVGSTPSIAAGQKPRGLVTIAPSAGLASMYDHQFQSGVPYFLQWVGPMFAYELLALERDLPGGEHFGRHPEETGCGMQNSSLTAGHGQATGEYQAWHAQRDWRDEAAAADVPIFMIHGVNDNAARIPAAEWFFGRRFGHPGDKVWLGQWDHGSAGNTRCEEADDVGHVNCRFDQWKYALHAWFDKHLQGRKVDTGPSVEAFLNTGEVWTARSWERPSAIAPLRLDAREMTVSGTAPDENASASFGAGPGQSIEFTSEPMSADRLFVGLPASRLFASLSSSQALNLIATVQREDADGKRHPMTYCALQPQLRHGLSTPAPIVPGEVMELELQCFTMAHLIREGERIVVSIGTESPHHAPTHTTDLQVTIHTGPDGSRFALPLVPRHRVYEDVPRFEEDPLADVPAGPAQQSIAGSGVTAAPGLGVRSPATSTFFEFEVTEETNARLEALVEFGAPGDVDLYLQRQLEDGTWSDDLTSGTSASLENETLQLQLPDLGVYRLELHNWAGPPGNPLDILVRFFNRDGEPGPDPE